jgi:hypothetical protein
LIDRVYALGKWDKLSGFQSDRGDTVTEENPMGADCCDS